MPFKSKAQQRWMFATKPEMAKEWADHTPDFKKLPERAMPSEGPTSHRGPHNIAHAAHKKGYEKVAELMGVKIAEAEHKDVDDQSTNRVVGAILPFGSVIHGLKANKGEGWSRWGHSVLGGVLGSTILPGPGSMIGSYLGVKHHDYKSDERSAAKKRSQPSINVGGNLHEAPYERDELDDIEDEEAVKRGQQPARQGLKEAAELFNLEKEAIFGFSAREKAEAAYMKQHNAYVNEYNKPENLKTLNAELEAAAKSRGMSLHDASENADLWGEMHDSLPTELRLRERHFGPKPSIHVGGPKLAFDFGSAGRMLQTGAGLASMVPGVGQIGGAALGALGGVGQALGNGEGLKGALSRGAIGGAVGAIPGGGLMQTAKQVGGGMIGGAIGDKINAPKPPLPVQPQQPGGMPFGPMAR